MTLHKLNFLTCDCIIRIFSLLHVQCAMQLSKCVFLLATNVLQLDAVTSQIVLIDDIAIIYLSSKYTVEELKSFGSIHFDSNPYY